MNTETKVLHIRRATVLDAVNIFRLIVGEEKRARVESRLDDATRLTDIVVTISTGYVSVAESSGRIVGTIGALVSDTTPVLVGAFFAVSPSYHDTDVPGALVSGLLRAADQAELPVMFSLPTTSAYSDQLSEKGFEVKTVVWGRENKKSDSDADSTEADAAPGSDPLELAADDQGHDAESGAPDGDDEPEGDAGPDFAAARSLARGDQPQRAP